MAFTGNYLCNSFVSALLSGTAPVTSSTYKVALYTDAATLNADTAAYTSGGEVVADGYDAGGQGITVSLTLEGTSASISFGDVEWMATLTARGALVYIEDGPAVCVLDFGADKTSKQLFSVKFPVASTSTGLIVIK